MTEGTVKCKIIVRYSRDMENTTESSPRSQLNAWMYQLERPGKLHVMDATAVDELRERQRETETESAKGEDTKP